MSSSNQNNYKKIMSNLKTNTWYTISLQSTKTTGSATTFTVSNYYFGTPQRVNSSTTMTLSPSIRTTWTFKTPSDYGGDIIIYAGISGSTIGNAFTFYNISVVEGTVPLSDRAYPNDVRFAFSEAVIDNTLMLNSEPLIRCNFVAYDTNPLFNLIPNDGTNGSSVTIFGAFNNGNTVIIDGKNKNAIFNGSNIKMDGSCYLVSNKINIIQSYHQTNTFEIDYLSYDVNNPLEMEFRTDFSITNTGKKVLLPKKFSTSPVKEYRMVSKQVTFDFTLPYYNSDIINLVNDKSTYRTEIYLKNLDTLSETTFIICNCQFDVTISGSEANPIEQKITGNGVML